MPVSKMKSTTTEDGLVKVTMEVVSNGETTEFETVGETLLGTIGEGFCKVIDEELGEITEEELLLNAVSGRHGEKMVTLRLIANHNGQKKEVVHSGEGILESVIHALRKMKD